MILLASSEERPSTRGTTASLSSSDSSSSLAGLAPSTKSCLTSRFRLMARHTSESKHRPEVHRRAALTQRSCETRAEVKGVLAALGPYNAPHAVAGKVATLLRSRTNLTNPRNSNSIACMCKGFGSVSCALPDGLRTASTTSCEYPAILAAALLANEKMKCSMVQHSGQKF